MTYLNVAKKNDDAKTIASQLSNEKITIEIYLLYREGFSKFNKNSEFEPAQRNNNRFSTRKPELLSKLEDREASDRGYIEKKDTYNVNETLVPSNQCKTGMKMTMTYLPP
ncbi:hypothetical protein GQX74_009623 [Glossina fuscipes]|nr:hypothetical protein GQX74_009623 [Glossina fuscipes]